jgi:mRNA-degrading endonuclease RelE of RelBE toxin-antitoxin system
LLIGMPYKILPTKEFAKDFSKLNKTDQKTIKKKIEEASEKPERFKRLHYELQGSFRLRIGKLRVIYSIDKKKNEMYLEKIVFKHKY